MRVKTDLWSRNSGSSPRKNDSDVARAYVIGRGRIETVATKDQARLHPGTTQGDTRQRKVERAMGIEPKRTALQIL